MEEIHLTHEDRHEEENKITMLQKILIGESLAPGGEWPKDPITKKLYEETLQGLKNMLLGRYRVGKCLSEALNYGGDTELREVIERIEANMKDELGPLYEAYPEKLTMLEAKRQIYFARAADARVSSPLLNPKLNK